MLWIQPWERVVSGYMDKMVIARSPDFIARVSQGLAGHSNRSITVREGFVPSKRHEGSLMMHCDVRRRGGIYSLAGACSRERMR